MPVERLIVWKQDGVLDCEDLGGHESRHLSVLRLIEQADAEYGLPDFPRTAISTADRPVAGALCFSAEGDGAGAVPDFLFDGWPEVGIPDYEAACEQIAVAGMLPAARPLCGWIGNADTSPLRASLLALAGRSRLLEAWHTPWPPYGSERLTLPEQVSRWGMLLDIEGNGWSARLKLLLHSGRPVLVVDRPWREFWFPEFRAWEHFVPVRRDLSDLLERVSWVLEHPGEAERIGRAGQAFARERLSRRRALEEWARVLSMQGEGDAGRYGDHANDSREGVIS